LNLRHGALFDDLTTCKWHFISWICWKNS